ncbi:10991_t:CDS:2 [Diversispora eburnea]|uniref:10991_t:CDS:1 n=1 Tax=Diversispora eburnea TaxID=1213867 RepID=A0A9N9FNU5_9GLOM|nr:10991_t:CDS:2 [Diversispora eburnea]
MYPRRKPVPEFGDSSAPAKSPLRNSGASLTVAVSGATHTTILKPVISTMAITNPLSTSNDPILRSSHSTDSVYSSNSPPSYDRDFTTVEKLDYEESIISKRRGSGNIRLPSLAIAILLDTTDEMLMQLLISQAVIDAKDFEILSLEEVGELKRDHSLLTTRITALTSKLSLESKIREAASSLARLHASNKRLSRQATDHLSQANRKVDQVATELWKLTQRAGEVQRRLLQHMAGILCMGFRKLEENQAQLIPQNPAQNSSSEGTNGTNGIDNLFNEIMGMNDKGSDPALLGKVTNLENSLHTAHQTLADARLALKQRTIAELRSELEEVGSRLDIILRKHKANNRQRDSNFDFEESAEPDYRGSFYRLSTMTTATQHLQKEQYKNISDNLGELEKALEGHVFRLYKLEQELNSIKNNSDDDTKSLQQNNNVKQVEDLELQVKEMEATRNELEETKLKLFEIESKADNAISKVENTNLKQNNLLQELEDEREKLTAAKEKIRKYEAILKRQSVIQIVDNGTSIKEEFQQQLAAQEQEYEAQIKESEITISKLRKDLQKVNTEKDNISQVVRDLEDMLKSKSRTLDQKEGTIYKLEGEVVSSNEVEEKLRVQLDEALEEVKQLKLIKENLELKIQKLDETIATAQHEFSIREKSLEKGSDALHKELDAALREFDRLTKNFMDFDEERIKLQSNIDKLQKKCEQLENELSDEKINHIGNGSNNNGNASTVALRKEFRKMIGDLKIEHKKELEYEIEEKKKLEATLRNNKREKEAKKWDADTKGTQTRCIISVG